MKFLSIVFATLITGVSLAADQSNVDDGATYANWPSYGGTDMAWRYSALDQVNTNNVKKLRPAWIFQTGEYSDALQSTPIVIDGVMYLSTNNSKVFALNAATGDLIWQYDYPASKFSGGGDITDYVLHGAQNRGA